MTPLKNSRILVTSTSYGMYDPSLRSDLESQVSEVVFNETGRPLKEEELISKIVGIDGMIAGLDVINERVIDAADRLKVIARYGVGLDRVDLEAAKSKGIVVTNTPGANATSVAELTVGLILALMRSIPFANQETKAGRWPRLRGSTLGGKTVGLLGLGSIGCRVAQLLSGFECRVIGYDPNVTKSEVEDAGVTWLEHEDVVQQSDVLTLHLPALPSTENMIDSGLIGRMKMGAYLVNTARSELIDETALLHALEDGKLSGVALDSFRSEPPPPDHPLLQMENVIATPHTGSHTEDAANNMGKMALQDCLSVLRGAQPVHRVA